MNAHTPPPQRAQLAAGARVSTRHSCICGLPENLWPRESGVIIEDYSDLLEDTAHTYGRDWALPSATPPTSTPSPHQPHRRRTPNSQPTNPNNPGPHPYHRSNPQNPGSTRPFTDYWINQQGPGRLAGAVCRRVAVYPAVAWNSSTHKPVMARPIRATEVSLIRRVSRSGCGWGATRLRKVVTRAAKVGGCHQRSVRFRRR